MPGRQNNASKGFVKKNRGNGIRECVWPLLYMQKKGLKKLTARRAEEWVRGAGGSEAGYEFQHFRQGAAEADAGGDFAKLGSGELAGQDQGDIGYCLIKLLEELFEMEVAADRGQVRIEIIGFFVFADEFHVL
jgi:hypothetical protein